MQNFDSHNNLGHQHLNDVLCKHALFPLQVVVDIPPRHVLHNNVDFALILEGFPDGGEQCVLAYFPDPLALQNVELFYFPLVNYLHCVLVVILFVLRQHYIAEGAAAQVLDGLVVLGAVSWSLDGAGVRSGVAW